MEKAVDLSENFAKIGPRKRQSNIELYRIIVMLLIVSHHYVVNSGLFDDAGPIMANPLSGKSIYLLLFGAWGKTGINCFVLITGYFMCKGHATVSKFLKLLFEVLFYKAVIYIIFVLTGIERFSVKGAVISLLPVTQLEKGFTSCFLVFYLFIPVLNLLIHHMTELQHRYLLAVFGFFYVILGSVPKFEVTFNYVSWFVFLYFVASYIRLYPIPWLEKTKNCLALMAISLLLAISSVVVMTFLGGKFLHMFVGYFFISDSNRILALVCGITSFLFFKSIKIPYNKTINLISASTFGVLCIHANSAAMRWWLWVDVLDNVGNYDMCFIHSILSVLVIYIVCTAIDIVRINLIEKPFMKWFDAHFNIFQVERIWKESEGS